jgi:hypothetical protein
VVAEEQLAAVAVAVAARMMMKVEAIMVRA